MMQGNPQMLAMMLVGGFLAGEIKRIADRFCALLMLCGVAAGTTLMVGDVSALIARRLPCRVCCLSCFYPMCVGLA
ncbi:MAG: hypothetical protein ACLVJB_07340 [Christensenellales bacterium]